MATLITAEKNARPFPVTVMTPDPARHIRPRLPAAPHANPLARHAARGSCEARSSFGYHPSADITDAQSHIAQANQASRRRGFREESIPGPRNSSCAPPSIDGAGIRADVGADGLSLAREARIARSLCGENDDVKGEAHDTRTHTHRCGIKDEAWHPAVCL